MARARNIKPGFFKNEQLVELPYEYRLLFAGLWTLADREGYLEDRPKRIKMEIFPGDDVSVEKGLDALEKQGLILRYTVDEASYIHVCKFLEHQHPHHKEPPSTLPKPGASPGFDSDATGVEPETEQSCMDAKPGASPGQASDEPRASPSDSGFLIPDSLQHTRPSADGRGRPRAVDDGFDRFWAAYPKKVSKGQAKRAWSKLKPDADLLDRMLRAIAAAKAAETWRKEGGRYIPHPATWLNAEGWEDERESGFGRSDGQWWLASGHGTREAAIAAGVREPHAHARISEPA